MGLTLAKAGEIIGTDPNTIWRYEAGRHSPSSTTIYMREWVDIIRLDGNAATHEEDLEFEEQGATIMEEFIELFLTYTFTLQERVEIHTEGTPSRTSLGRSRHLPPP